MWNTVKKLILSRRVVVVALLLLQIFTITVPFYFLGKYMRIVEIILWSFSVIVVLYIISKRDKPAYKIIWIISIFAFPVFGGLFYFLLRFQATSGRLKKTFDHYDKIRRDELLKYPDASSDMRSDYPEFINRINYLTNTAGFSVCSNTQTTYLSPGEEFYPHFIEALESAKKFIFIEFFIISEGKMWDKTLEILKRKAAEGVDVRVMYDDVGSVGCLPARYGHSLGQYGIKCKIFNPFRPLWTSVQNNRDHRKIVVVDGKVGFTGGINIADEYIGLVQRFGDWKDCAVEFRGDAVWSFTVMFLELWNAVNHTDEDYSKFHVEQPHLENTRGYVIPYSDSPHSGENVCEHVYMQMITGAKRYMYIETPYLILDDSMQSALILAAKSGVDIRIITPAIPDKKMVFMTTRSYYKDLMDAGISIYEYTPGFIHSKVAVCDDIIAAVGTPNFDFRSLYLHFECGSLLVGTQTVQDVKQDFLNLLPKCHKVTTGEVTRNPIVRTFQSVLRIFAPLF
ncbi:MAG: cardiolipin synthase [Clostridia bacterium]|nr:cardiolipin synthase [Clostridia bacterium]